MITCSKCGNYSNQVSTAGLCPVCAQSGQVSTHIITNPSKFNIKLEKEDPQVNNQQPVTGQISSFCCPHCGSVNSISKTHISQIADKLRGLYCVVCGHPAWSAGSGSSAIRFFEWLERSLNNYSMDRDHLRKHYPKSFRFFRKAFLYWLATMVALITLAHWPIGGALIIGIIIGFIITQA